MAVTTVIYLLANQNDLLCQKEIALNFPQNNTALGQSASIHFFKMYYIIFRNNTEQTIPQLLYLSNVLQTNLVYYR